MMDTIRQALDSFLVWALLPATLYGAGGAALRSIKAGKKRPGVIVFEALAGIIIANMAGPLLAKYAPVHWHATLYFLAGWGGLAAVDYFYSLALRVLTTKIWKDFDGAQWDGVERRKGGE